MWFTVSFYVYYFLPLDNTAMWSYGFLRFSEAQLVHRGHNGAGSALAYPCSSQRVVDGGFSGKKPVSEGRCPPRNSFSHFPSICLSLMQLQYQGSPFSDPGFSAPELQLSSLPPAAVSFKIWHAMDDAERLSQAQGAFLALTQHLQLVGDDQSDLNPGSPILLAQLGVARLRAQGLLGNMAAIMTALGLPIPPEEDTLGLVPFGASAFERKCRGYIVTREYGHWTDRAVRDLALLKAKYPA